MYSCHLIYTKHYLIRGKIGLKWNTYGWMERESNIRNVLFEQDVTGSAIFDHSWHVNRERYLLDYSLQSCLNVGEKRFLTPPSALLMPSVDGKRFDVSREYEASVAARAATAASVCYCQRWFAQFARVTPRQTEWDVKCLKNQTQSLQQPPLPDLGTWVSVGGTVRPPRSQRHRRRRRRRATPDYVSVMRRLNEYFSGPLKYLLELIGNIDVPCMFNWLKADAFLHI